MSEITLEDIVHPSIEEQKPPETIPKEDLFENSDLEDGHECMPTEAAESTEVYPDEKIENGGDIIIDISIYVLVILLLIVMFFIFKP